VGASAIKQNMYGLETIIPIKVGSFGVIVNIVKQKHFINVLKHRKEKRYDRI
jgi:hypothetical protein